MKPPGYIIKKKLWEKRSESAKDAVIGAGGAYFRSFWAFVDPFEPVLTLLDMRNGGQPSKGMAVAMERFGPGFVLKKSVTGDAVLYVVREESGEGLFERWLSAFNLFGRFGIVRVVPTAVVVCGNRLIFPFLCGDRVPLEFIDRQKLPRGLSKLLNVVEAGNSLGLWEKSPPSEDGEHSAFWSVDIPEITSSRRKVLADAIELVPDVWFYCAADALRGNDGTGAGRRAAAAKPETPASKENGPRDPIAEMDAIAILSGTKRSPIFLSEMNRDSILPD